MLKKTVFAVMGLLAMVSVGRAGETAPKTLSVSEVAQKLHDKSVHVYDCNGPESFASGHVPGAKAIEYAGFSAKDLNASKGDTLIFYCLNEH